MIRLISFFLVCASAFGQSHKNVVVVRTDDMAWADLQQLKSDGTPVMPNTLNLLAAGGTVFTNFITAPVCAQSRASFLTGRTAHNTGIYGNIPPLGGFQEFDASNTLATVLQNAGVQTGYEGKYLNGYTPQDPPQPGWSDWFATDRHIYLNFDANSNGVVVNLSGQENYHTDVLTRRALQFIRANEKNQFFYLVDYLGPHQQFPPVNQSTLPIPATRHLNTMGGLFVPGRAFNEIDVSDKPLWIQQIPPTGLGNTQLSHQRRLESLRSVDEGIGRIVATLDGLGLLNQTAIIFLSDNGWQYGTHKLPAKQSAYEETICVPFVISAPWLSGSQVISDPVANIDLAATILEMMGAPNLVGQEGQSLVPLILNTKSSPDRVVLLESDILTEPHNYTGVRSKYFTWVEYTNGDRELYPLALDPFQLDSQHLNLFYQTDMDSLHLILMDLASQ